MGKEITFKKIVNLAKDVYAVASNPHSIPLVYFNEVRNVGDLVSPYLVQRISRRRIHRAHTSALPRLLGVGSILGSATQSAYVWGSGLISPEQASFSISPEKVVAVRGRKTLDYLYREHSLKRDLVLGDPALLMPLFYRRVPSPTEDRVGIIPHYVDIPRAVKFVAELGSPFTIIDVRQDPESFINDLTSCKAVLSSSLHGLILADAYQIPNVWVSLSREIVGGAWKFKDYYSTTDSPNRSSFSIDGAGDCDRIVKSFSEYFHVCWFQGNVSELIEVFPKVYRSANVLFH